ncbi:mechanosensitive ion channel family protein [Lewinella cohaerens]|uniref:mechanosensitive ion channel family protein n=1 Tax=Lewinella cohaerens TaxID=70995 RepID=UPI0003673D3B|nr:mechanosensitive ion channel family protein [Lewinella cohaerens]
MEFDTSQIEGWANTLIDLAFIYGPPLLLGLIILVVGLKVIAKIHKLVSKAMQVAGISESLVPFLSSVVSVGLKIVLFLAIASIIGINIASFVAILAAASFAVGLALQGSLSNFAAGIIILIFRPYKVDQWIEVCDKFGRVEEIQIFNTLIVTPGNKTLIIPNGQIVDNIVTNFSEKGHVRIELAVSMPYGEDFPRVEKIIMDVLQNTPGVLDEPAPTVGIETFDSHNIILTVRPYVNPDDYWPVTFDVNRNIKAAFNSHNVQVSYSEGIELGPIGK